MLAELKYDVNKTYKGNEPFLRHNKQEYHKEKVADALRKEEETKRKMKPVDG
jgi:hypothetical protein